MSKLVLWLLSDDEAAIPNNLFVHISFAEPNTLCRQHFVGFGAEFGGLRISTVRYIIPFAAYQRPAYTVFVSSVSVPGTLVLTKYNKNSVMTNI